MKLNIIIPHHNTAALLQRCLDSIPDEDNISVIVVDDNSSPELVDFDNFPGRERTYTKVFFTKEGKGAGYARNIGLEHAEGAWVLFADSDDFFVSNFYEIVSNYFSSDADMILFKADSVNSDTLEPSYRNENINARIDECVAGRISSKDASIAVQSPWCRLIRRDFIEKNKIRFDEVIASNDTMFTTKCTCLSSIIMVVPKVIYTVTFRNGSLWDSRKTNPNSFLTRLRVQIRKNKYIVHYGYKTFPVAGYVLQASKISFLTFLKAFMLVIREGALFHGTSFTVNRLLKFKR